MKKLRNLILTFLSILPLSRVAIAAEATLLAEEGEVRTEDLLGDIRIARGKLFPDMQMVTTIEEAKARLRTQLRTSDELIIDAELNSAVEVLIRHRLINIDETKMEVGTPSRV